MTEPFAAVTAIGMVTSLGRTASASCAAARAGLSAPTPLGGIDFANDSSFGREGHDGVRPVFGHPTRGVADAFSGPARLQQLGAAALDDLLAQRPLTQRQLLRTALLAQLSDAHVERAAGDETSPASAAARNERVLTALAKHHAFEAAPARRVLRVGGASLGRLLVDATTLLAERVVDQCIVGAIDSRVGPSFLRAAGSQQQLRTSENPTGLIPGEAAAFLLLERGADAQAAGTRVLATVRDVALATDAQSLLDTERAPSGEGLARVVHAVLRGRTPAFLVSDLTGTARRAVEWGTALARLASDGYRSLPAPWLPARSFGDAGAALGAIALCVAARAYERGYAPGNGALVCMSSESGDKSAMILSQA